ncbi:hypothetical protein QBC35DRAFT_373465 [Podospora australis]|uniref:Uncharacterized protein n=1 Tax=Podospora australis TaxID=1536484 RepID=A0AAN7AKX1_9PEZI|nr:hypothetical protein QBC35DRAFT_373465 [Podospora australis]
MFCGIPQHNNSHRLLRSFRSHKSLKQEAAHHPNNMHFRHHHSRPSDMSSMARTSMESATSSRPSTSGGKSELSVDWDPLRLHPPLACAPVPHLPEEIASRRYQPQEPKQARSMHNLRAVQQQQQQQASRPSRHQHQASTATVIYGGFDFGFNDTNTHPVPRRAPSPTPSSVSDASSTDGSRDAEEWGDNIVVTPLPAPRHRQPRQTGPPATELEAEHFMKRGGWKRRGIVFVSEATTLASEEESWEM